MVALIDIAVFTDEDLIDDPDFPAGDGFHVDASDDDQMRAAICGNVFVLGAWTIVDVADSPNEAPTNDFKIDVRAIAALADGVIATTATGRFLGADKKTVHDVYVTEMVA